MAKEYYQRKYNGGNLTTVTPRLTELSAPFSGKIKYVSVKTDFQLIENATGSAGAVFEIFKNGVLLAGAEEIVISEIQNFGELTNLDISVIKDDVISLHLTEKTQNGAIEAPITFNVTFDDGVASGVSLVRSEQTFSTASLAPNASANLDVAVGKSVIEFITATNAAARVRAYSTAGFRTADQNRAIGSENVGEVILLEDITTDANLTTDTNLTATGKAAVLFNGDNPATDTIYFRIENRSATAQAIDVTITKLTLEN